MQRDTFIAEIRERLMQAQDHMKVQLPQHDKQH
jgi:hypothetical protein